MSSAAAALAGTRVLEISALGGAVAGRVLADLGAEVIKIEPHGGEPFRRSVPLVPTTKGEESAAWLAFNHGKKSVTLDLATDEGVKAFERLCESTDIVLTDWERLDLDTMERLARLARGANPALVWTEVLPFGRGGPYERYAATDTTLQALGGHLYLNGDVDRPPVRISLPVGVIQGGAEAASAALMAHWHALRTGEGQRVDVSVQACVVWTLLNSTMAWQILGLNEMRGGAIRKERANRFYTRLVWEAQDGYIFFGPVGGGGGSARIKSYEALLAWMGEDGITDNILTRHDWNGDGQFFILQEDYDAVTAVIVDFIRTKTMEELMARAVEHRILLAPISSVESVFENAQFRAREYFRPLSDEGRGLDIELPARWANLSATPLIAPSPAPLPGADTSAILSQKIRKADGLSFDTSSAASIGTTGLFAGLKVADFTWAAAGPIATKQLADNGATVVKVESFKHPDSIRLGGPFIDDKPGINRSGFFADFHSSKLGMSVDMSHPAAKEIIRPLIEWADVVAESFRPGVMKKWGLSYEDLRTINPGIVMLSSSLYGADGPWARHPGYGAQGQALAGIHYMTGWPDRAPAMPKGAYSDSVSPRYALSALVAALIHREKTGEGQHVELSQIEATAQLLGPELLAYQVTGKAATRAGSRKPGSVLHGVFPCAGDERWIAIEVVNDTQFAALCELLDAPEALTAARSEGLEALDTAMAEQTAPWDAFELMAACRSAEVPAGVANKASDLLEDDVLNAHGHFWPLEHAEMGNLRYNGPAYRFEKTPGALRFASPRLGEHTQMVMTEILGFGGDDISRFREKGLLQ